MATAPPVVIPIVVAKGNVMVAKDLAAVKIP